MEPEGLMPCSQEPAIGSQTNPVYTIPYYFSKILFNIIFPFITRFS
jgi:hypothetical protein